MDAAAVVDNSSKLLTPAAILSGYVILYVIYIHGFVIFQSVSLLMFYPIHWCNNYVFFLSFVDILIHTFLSVECSFFIHSMRYQTKNIKNINRYSIYMLMSVFCCFHPIEHVNILFFISVLMCLQIYKIHHVT